MSQRIVLLFIVALLTGCIQGLSAQEGESVVLLATTTSTYDSGLLDYVLPVFEGIYEIEVRVIPVGTGRALELGRRGDVDVILVHSPDDEEIFVSEGYGTERHCVMYNDFVIVGPEDDPAGIRGEPAVDALKKIAVTGSTFISRGDSSGTHKKELALWVLAERYHGRGSWYVETGTGMGKTLLVASEREGYTLVDRGTYISMKDSVDLVALVSGDSLLANPYGIIAVSPQKHPGVNSDGAQKLVDWMISEDGQQLIGYFTREGERLFTPLHGACMEG